MAYLPPWTALISGGTAYVVRYVKQGTGSALQRREQLREPGVSPETPIDRHLREQRERREEAG